MPLDWRVMIKITWTVNVDGWCLCVRCLGEVGWGRVPTLFLLWSLCLCRWSTLCPGEGSSCLPGRVIVETSGSYSRQHRRGRGMFSAASDVLLGVLLCCAVRGGVPPKVGLSASGASSQVRVSCPSLCVMSGLCASGWGLWGLDWWLHRVFQIVKRVGCLPRKV